MDNGTDISPARSSVIGTEGPNRSLSENRGAIDSEALSMPDGPFANDVDRRVAGSTRERARVEDGRRRNPIIITEL